MAVTLEELPVLVLLYFLAPLLPVVSHELYPLLLLPHFLVGASTPHKGM